MLAPLLSDCIRNDMALNTVDRKILYEQTDNAGCNMILCVVNQIVAHL